jgi:NADH-quinone oxidoreductase subunit L
MSEPALLTSLLTAVSLPLLSSIIARIISVQYQWVVPIISTLLMLASAILSIVIASGNWNNTAISFEIDWFRFGLEKQSAGLWINNTTLLLLVVVCPISFLVHLFSVGYMADDKRIRSYFSMLGFFTFSMLGLVVASNLLLLFIFWELVGFSSYMLIGHWYERAPAANAATKAFIINRVSDVSFIIGILIIWANAPSLSLAALAGYNGAIWQTTATLFILLSVVGKSAQFPLFNWLPSAMEGPTPVSALIHAATMVIAGVFLLIRLFPMLSPVTLSITTGLGALTAITGALCALQQFDIKKILAYSTISQLGLMVAAIGIGAYGPALLHLFTHAFFKAGLFLCAGVILHTLQHDQRLTSSTSDIQDIRFSGGLARRLPVTFICFTLCSASLAGVPMTSGFLSKDAILASFFSLSVDSWQRVSLALIVLTSLITVLYSFRLIWYLFLSPVKSLSTQHSPEAPMVLLIPIGVLAVFSLWWIVSVNPLQYNDWLLQSIQSLSEHNTIVTLGSGILIPLICLAAWFWFKSRAAHNPDTVAFLRHGFYLDKINEVLVVKPVIKLSIVPATVDKIVIDGAIHTLAYLKVGLAHTIGWIDTFIIDGVVNAIGWMATKAGSLARSFGAGKIQSYLFWSLFALIIFLFWALF